MYYADTSALVKLVVQEPHSEDVASLLTSADAVFTSVVAWPEYVSALERRRRTGGLTPEAHAIASRNFDRVRLGWSWIQLPQPLAEAAARLAAAHGLRGFDAVHLASALAAARRQVIDAFLTFDRQLAGAAEQEGLAAWPPYA